MALPKNIMSTPRAAAPPKYITSCTVWRTWLFIAHSDEVGWLYFYQFSLHHSYISLQKVGKVCFLNVGVKEFSSENIWGRYMSFQINTQLHFQDLFNWCIILCNIYQYQSCMSPVHWLSAIMWCLHIMLFCNECCVLINYAVSYLKWHICP